MSASNAREYSGRIALTTPSLSGVWAALRFRLGVTVRTNHAAPADLRVLDQGLQRLPPPELRILTGSTLSAAASDFVAVLTSTCGRLIASERVGGAKKPIASDRA